ncbi:hypothetical protein HN51_009156 [Arachis hypogaea]|uniref:aminobutyraldehyde dehydrogenase n=1 Tax=Arachis hypogaea TaxID=3818 RepID=A0A445D0F7_ARAHY|nr:betaine aldehyde dehydrogenase 1, chloroplastic [Arachis hypogaea]QHO43617.1 Betaine aldehyde dehydrogenase 1 [Arachis hypogaea]RYR56689.1 hypothetical protein Ahy_A05g022379 [Arachis hypogaea]
MAISTPRRELFIDGEWKAPLLNNRIPIINPSTELIIGDIPAATKEDVELAVDAARRALSRNKGRDWSTASGSLRATYLRAIAAKITEKKDELAKLEATDNGKPLDEAAADMDDVISCFSYYAELAEGLDAKQKAHVSLPMENFKSYVIKEPIGVVALITPWNYPLLMAAWKVGAALAAGCTAVLKPSELASVTCLELAEICKEVGLPAGVLNVITGLGTEAGAPLASHPDVDKISFTGSSATGSKIMQAAALQVKPVSLELGGKSPIIVFDDVDIDKVAEWTMLGCFFTNGQICSATSRLIVHENIATKFLNRLVEWAKNIKVSDPLEDGCKLGAIVSEAQYQKVLKFISTAKSEGATILTGGSRPENLKKGYFVEPTIITDVSTSMQIWREEVFGPVLCAKTFSSEEEAIELANDTHYGLGSAVMSNDPERCERISKAVQAGIVWINCSQPTFIQAPWGGIKRSGFGRELGEWGLDNFLSVKQVTKYISDEQWGWYKCPSKM